MWATRPEAHNKAWEAELKTQGWRVETCSLMSIKAVEDADGQALIRRCVQDLDLYSYVFFVSQNAVHAFFDWCEHYWPQLPIGVLFLGVGQRTQQAINTKLMAMGGYQDSEKTPSFDHNSPMTSAELLDHAITQNVKERRVLICRGRGGLPLLGETLADRGARVDYCELYDRSLPENAPFQVENLLAYSTRHCVPVFSGESLTGLHTILERISANVADAHSLKTVVHFKAHVSLVVPSERVACEAQRLGFTHIFRASNATEASMLKAIEQGLQRFNSHH